MTQAFAAGDIIQGKYEIKAVLGTGGMGTVYRARQIDLGRDVAIKVPNPQALEIPGFLQRFSREARLVAKLQHDNIVQVYEYVELPEGIFIVMEYVEGQDLKSLITRAPADLTVKDLAIILRSACEGLAHAHENGIVHRDIKPHNIMVEQRARGKWRVKIMDFGIAHADANAQMTMMNNQEQLTVTGQAIGTPSYMSPEQIRGSGVSAKSDIYSMGCVIFYVFTRTTPFQGTGFTVAASHLSDAPPAIRSRAPELPDEVEAVVFQCLNKDPEQRPIDASELGQALFESLMPIQDKHMAEIWPSSEHAGGGTDVLRQTRPLDGQTNQRTETDAQDQRSSVHPADSEKIPGVRNMSKTATLPPRGALRTQPESPHPGASEKTSVTGQTSHTIPYQHAQPGAPADAGQAPAAAPKKSSSMMVLAFLIPLLVIGVAIGYYVVTNKPGSTTVSNGNGSSSGTSTSTDSAHVPTPTPAATPEATAAATATVSPSPSARPTPSPDPVVVRVDSLKGFFAKATSLNDRAQLWQQAASDPNAKDSRLASLIDEMATTIVKNPEMHSVGAGRFTMGSPANEGEAEERPQNNVSFRAYDIGKYEVTALEFATFLNAIGPEEAANLYKPTPQTTIRLNEETKKYEPVSGKMLYPANGVSWNAATAYANWLTQQTGDKYRLPTEAEWENAARAGSSFRYPWGDNEPSGRQAQYNAGTSGPVSVLEMANGRNVWDLAHMAGNVAEWCQDWYAERTYDEGDRDNPSGPEIPSANDRRPRKVVRGGSFQSLYSSDIRNARRDRVEPDKSSADIGFRLVREPKSS
ncbi:SUMF1/EgtB/PvdO family nonheme iron enzyme [Candidatus Sumerlaeota bacterium]|nr:SUMF1/EgtB/PvdO family nonheme iron enzyme [Candidatus Sumerlaeota bacterium]